ncbi:MAG: hypothetical protein WDA60_14505 [Acidimicrobiia bacterium]|jgi:hypothetical protein
MRITARPAPVATLVAALVALVATLVLTQTIAPAPAAAAGTTCTQDWRPAAVRAYLNPDGSPTDPAVPLPAPPSAAHQAFHVFCGGHYVNTVWLGPSVTTREAVRVAAQLAARAVYPSVRPAVNPARGLTGLASWFWAEPDPSPVRMVAGNGPALDVELRVQTVRWHFGDGTTGSISGLGVPFPAPSPVSHVFERTGTYTIDGQVVIAGHYWFEELNADLPTGSHTVTLRHEVAEVRSLLHAR